MASRPKETTEQKLNKREAKLARMLSIIQNNPGIRASEINREMQIEHTWNLRSKLIKRGLVRKEKEGAAVRYYVI
ncbi:MAG: hypothetical protein ACR2QW_04575 [bacterium]